MMISWGFAISAADGGKSLWGTAMQQENMPVEKKSIRKPTWAALCAGFGIFLIIAGGGGAALAGDDDDELPDIKFMRNFLRGLGLRNGEEAGIEYKERPPLVVPPNRNLPPPETTGSLAERNPAWPVDPDIQQRKADKKAKSERRRIEWDDLGKPLTPAELAAGKTNRTTTATATPVTTRPSVENAGQTMSPDELGYKGGLWGDFFGIGKAFSKDKEETANFVREPARSALTDPPAGYRTPSPTQPYGVRASRDKAKGMTEEGRQTDTVNK
jgi:hypothetical protein